MSTTIVQNSFLPTQISGCQLWLDAADPSVVIKSGTTVTAWNDKSGNTYNMNALPMNQYQGIGPAVYPSVGTAINRLSTIYFSPWAGLKQATVINGAKNLYWVGRISSDTTDSYFLMGADTTYDWHANGGVNTTILASAYAQSGILAASPASQYTSGANAVVNTTFSNIVYPSAGNISLLSVAGLSGNTRYQGVCFDRQDHTGWCGDLAEVIIFSNALTTAQHQQVEGYLAAKWGLQSTLPSNHPYRYSAYFTNLAYVSTIVSPSVTNRITNASFLPTTIPGCKLWVDGADPAGTGVIPANGATISTWVDKSGLGNNATGGGSAVTYSSAGLYFGGSSYYSVPGIAGTLANTPFVIFIVETFTGTSGFLFADDTYNGNNSTLHIGYRNTTQVTFAFWANDIEDPGLSATVNTRVWGFYLPSGSNRNIRRNGSVDVTGTNATNLSAFTSPVIGRVLASLYYTGTISEIIVYNTDIGLPAIQQVEGYLAWKWRLQANLPSNHPYKKSSAVFVTQPNLLAILGTNSYNNTMLSGYFNPTSIAGSVLWLDGKDTSPASMTLSGTTVITWKDKSGGGRNATSVNNPKLLSSGGVSFNGPSAQYFTMSVPYTNTNTMFMVASPVPSTTSAMYYFNTNNPNYCGAIFLGGYNSSYVCAFYPANPSIGGNPNQEPVLSAGLPTTPFLVTSVKTAGVSAFGYYNGAQAYSQGDTATAGPSYWDFLGAAGVGYNYLTANIYEVIFYSSALTTVQRQKVEGYLAWKWGIQANLPATHPYILFPPPP